MNRGKLNAVYNKQLSLSNQMKENLLSISSQYNMSMVYPDAAYVELAQKCFLDIFKPLDILNNREEASIKFSEIVIPLQQKFKESDGSRFQWLKSKRFKTKFFPTNLCIGDKFYPRCHEEQDVIFDANSKIGKNGKKKKSVATPQTLAYQLIFE